MRWNDVELQDGKKTACFYFSVNKPRRGQPKMFRWALKMLVM